MAEDRMNANEIVNVRRYNFETGNYEELAQCWECGHKVYREIDEDGTPRNERPVEYEEALALARELSE